MDGPATSSELEPKTVDVNDAEAKTAQVMSVLNCTSSRVCVLKVLDRSACFKVFA